jgi:hypothetical protein
MEATKPTKQQINAAALEVIARISEGKERERLEREVGEVLNKPRNIIGNALWNNDNLAFSFWPTWIDCCNSNGYLVATFKLKSRKTV